MPVRPVQDTLTRDTLPKLCTEYAAILQTPGRGLWLVSNHWGRETILAELLKLTSGTFAPNILTFEELARRVAGDAIHSATASHWALHDTIGELHRKKSLPYHAAIVERRGFFTSSVGYFNELAENGISPEVAETALRMNRSPKREDIARLTKAFAERGKATGKGWSHEVFDRAAERMAAGLPKTFERLETVFVTGFRFFHPCERRLLDALAGHVGEVRVTVFTDPAKSRPGTYAECKETWESFLDPKPKVSGKTGKEPKYDRPAGIAHLAGNLFRENAKPGKMTAGVSLVKAPGVLGEMRLIARRIRQLLNSGGDPERVVVMARDPSTMIHVLPDVFAEYRIPVFHEVEEPLQANPAVRTLLRAAQLSADGWPFEDVTALLRSNYFRPVWPEAADDLPRHAEGLLRQLGEPRGRDSYLRAAITWAQKPPEALEDEQAEEHRRRRKGELAKRCLPFLRKFFDLWEEIPAATPASGFSAWLRSFAAEIGLAEVANEREADRQALAAFWKMLADWQTPSIRPAAFWRGVSTIARHTMRPRSANWTGRVRVLSPESAVEVDCDHLFVTGLGEKSFPAFGLPESLLDESDRAVLRDHGLKFPHGDCRLPREQLLFLQLVARPCKELIFSYPAVDDAGQDMLPAAFLRAVTEAFEENAIPTTNQRMLIEGYLTQEALSDAEYRVQLADRMREAPDDGRFPTVGLKPELIRHLRAAKHLTEARFHEKAHNEFSGLFLSDSARQRIRERFGPERVFSPTALETYVACPFRFWLEHLLGLEELEEPGEEIEHTRRGSAYHRALSRLHRRLRETDPEMTRKSVPEHVTDDLAADLTTAIEEYVARAPSEVSKMLWKLEGERLQRSVLNYRNDWNDYLGDWHKEKLALAPALFEVDFGFDMEKNPEARPPLVIKVGETEVRIGGRIDRVDVAELTNNEVGFWVIDYKTGRRTNYVASQLLTLEKLQLPLYALAVQKVFYPDQPARPLGLAYWLVTDEGTKRMLPAGKKSSLGWFRDPAEWETYRGQLEAWVVELITRIRDAQFPLAPRSETCTETCSFSQACRIAQSRHVEKDWRLELPMMEKSEETSVDVSSTS
ncbi:PD-(D/E)XK nuclease family protein [Zavarzinella formosa]|uniref:PD-(D/E)XK nuclease family protein n=1 Tax=Zavarzinella formosa TaxID=360055 RepID=UPI00030FC9DC|nr:PD-(D/E)XK nuclease family protein [Zavarzinella formosa]